MAARIAVLRQIADTRTRQGYETAIAGVWSGLTPTLRRLESLAADPAAALGSDESIEELSRLQYALHTAGEIVEGLAAPSLAEGMHAELAASLAEARDATADIVHIAEAAGAEAAEPYVYEWRGALFRIRLARLRLARPPVETEPEPRVRSLPFPLALVAWVLVAVGALIGAAGAVAGSWELVGSGVAGLAAGVLIRRP